MPNQKNIRLMYGISLLQGLVFYAPIATLYRRAVGVTMLQITLIESISLVLSLLLEMPWGVAADRIGYKNTIVVCNGLYFLSKVIFWQAQGFGGFLAERILLAIVVSGLSGVDTTLLYLSCPEDRQQKVFALYENLGTAGMLAASVLYSLCFGNDYRLAGFWTMVGYGAAMAASLFLREPEHPARLPEDKGSLLTVTLSVLKRPRLLILLIAFGCLCETGQTVTVFLNQLQYERAGIPGSLMGFLLAGVNILGFLGVLSHRLTVKLGERRTSLLLFGAGAVSCGMLAVTRSPVLSVLGVASLGLAVRLFSPLQTVIENRQVRTANRATELSVYAMLLDGLAAGTNVIFGRAADLSLPLALWIGAALCALGGILYLAATGKGKEQDSRS